MAVVAGIDEAGFGPVLGPLVVSAAAFIIPDQGSASTMWQDLAGAVSKKPSRKSGKIAIADSKKLYSRQRANPLQHIERGTLSMLATAGQTPAGLKELLELVSPQAATQMAGYPWYDGSDVPLPASITPDELSLAANSLTSAMRRAGISLWSIRCEPVFVGQYNAHLQATRNKCTVLLDISSRLLDWLWRNAPKGDLRIYVDRQGGRRRYLPWLQRIFPGCSLRVLDETKLFSAYQLTGRNRTGRICFITGGENHRLPVALASMISKYLRELFMSMFNGYWTCRLPDLSPTAGYYTDGRRFYKAIAGRIRQLGLDAQKIYRSR